MAKSSAVLIGRFTRDAETKTVGESSVTSFSLACPRREKKNGEWIEIPTFWKGDWWGRQAQGLSQYMTKGTLAAAIGEPYEETYQSEGQDKKVLKIRCDHVDLLEKAKESAARPANTPWSPSQEPSADGFDDGFDDDTLF